MGRELQIKREGKFECQRDGLTIRGLYFLPEGINLPVAVVSHELLANYDLTEYYARWFADLGYAAFCFDFCGGGPGCRSDGDTTKMSPLTEAEDLKAVIRYAWSLPETSGDRVTLMGCSLGGLASALVAAEMGDRVEQLILFYPAFSAPDEARDGKVLFVEFDPDDIPEVYQCGPIMMGKAYPETLQKMDAFSEISAYKGRVLIIHGTLDLIVNIRYLERAVDAYDNAELKMVPGGQHVFTGQYREIALSYVKEFLDWKET